MSDVWKIGQDIKAADFYKGIEKMLFSSERVAAKAIAGICDKMAETYEQAIDEQNEYLLEVEELNQEIEELKKELEAEVEARNNEIDELNSKTNEDGTFEDGVSDSIGQKEDEIAQLNSEFGSLISAKSAEIDASVNNSKQVRSKEKIATDYGETAVEKGQPLAETKDKRKSFWRKLTGSWDKSATREAGQKAVDSGNNLLEKVGISAEIDNEINKKTKVSK